MNLASASPSELDSQRYRLLAPIARGGMAELLLAATHGADECTKIVAVKRVWPELAHEKDFVAMFTDEARLAVRLNHPNVVQTFEVGRMDGRLFIAMEFLEGQTLNAVLARLRQPEMFSLPLRLRVLSHVLAGLHYAHELKAYDGTPLQVVHRDVSPQNVFITYDGAVKLLDFGIAKTLAASHQTLPGVMKGRVAYMAPESVRGEKVDRQADIFSVGIMLWETAANRRFWHGETETSILRKLISGKPLDLPALPSDVPAGLEDICRRALSSDRSDRHATAAEMQVEIDRLIAGSTDSYDRHLGTVVAHAFRHEQQQIRDLIDRKLRREPTLDEFESPVRATTRSYSVVPPPLPQQVQMATLEELAAVPWWRPRNTLLFIAGMMVLVLASWSGMRTLTARPQDRSKESAIAGLRRDSHAMQTPADVAQRIPPNFWGRTPAGSSESMLEGEPSRTPRTKTTRRHHRHASDTGLNAPPLSNAARGSAAPARQLAEAVSADPAHLEPRADAPATSDPFDVHIPHRPPSQRPSNALDVQSPYR